MQYLRRASEKASEVLRVPGVFPDAGPSIAAALAEEVNDVGCTVIYEGEKPLRADIVFVHGLGGHPVKTWSKGGVYWPKDLLGPSTPGVRILTFGYDCKAAKAFERTSQNNIRDHAKQLVSDVLRERKQEGETERPIIFVAHSLGGIVVKDALGCSEQEANFKHRLANIFLATYAVVFFGTPHRGSAKASLGVIAATACKAMLQSTNINLLRSLESSSETLARISDAFSKVLANREIRVHSFAEELETRGLGMVVDPASAFIGDAYEETDRIRADHREMVCFKDEKETGYRRAHDVVQLFAAEATEAVADGTLPKKLVASATARDPLFLVPFCKNPTFIGREETLKRLEELLSPNPHCNRRAALWGLGGIGKTTIAVEFCYRRKDTRPEEQFFWVHGNSEQTFKTSYLELGRKAGLVVTGSDEDQKLGTVKTWLESSQSCDWIMVIDGFDDTDLKLIKHLPVTRGAILYTTRNLQIAHMPPNSMLNITAMSYQEASDTLSGLLGDGGRAVETYAEAARQLLALLGELPLAITQVAAYIRQTSITLPEYLEDFRGCERNQQELLSKACPSELQDSEQERASRAVMTTWKITVDKIQQTSPNSVRLLELLSFLSHEDIPQELINSVTFIKPDKFHLREVAQPLLDFALVSRLETSNYRIHRLVASSVRAQMEQQAKEDCLERALELVLGNTPRYPFEDMPKCTQLLPHAVAVLEYIQKEKGHRNPDFELHWRLQDAVEAFSYHIGTNGTAWEWLQRALDDREKALGKDHPSTLGTVHNIANVFSRQGEFAKALEWYQRALNGFEKTPGKRHPSALHIARDMANVFRGQGEFAKALEWCQQALDGFEKTLGKNHPYTLGTVHNLANLFEDQGEFAKSLEWYQRALDGSEETLGKTHPYTLGTVRNMAKVFRDRCEFARALEWYQRVLDGFEETLGKGHPSTLHTVRNMANVFLDQGEFEKALRWYQRALHGFEETLGKGHPSALDTVRDMANAFQNQGEYAQALEWYQQAVNGFEKTLGKNHPSTLRTVRNMANAFRDKGEFAKSLEWHQRALDGFEETLGKGHPSTLGTVRDVANVFRGQGEFAKALEWHQRALGGFEEALGKGHSSTLGTVRDVANVFRGQGKFARALEWHQRALDGFEKTLGKGHPSTLRTVRNMANVFRDQGKFSKALEWHRRALDGFEETLGEGHPSTLRTVRYMANVFQDQGKFSEALEWYQRALDGFEKTLGKNHPYTPCTARNIANVFERQNKYAEALEWYKRALDGFEKTLGKSHTSTLSTVHNIANVFRGQGKFAKALEWYRRALDGFEKTMGKNHRFTLGTAHNIGVVSNALKEKTTYEQGLSDKPGSRMR